MWKNSLLFRKLQILQTATRNVKTRHRNVYEWTLLTEIMHTSLSKLSKINTIYFNIKLFSIRHWFYENIFNIWLANEDRTKLLCMSETCNAIHNWLHTLKSYLDLPQDLSHPLWFFFLFLTPTSLNRPPILCNLILQVFSLTISYPSCLVWIDVFITNFIINVDDIRSCDAPIQNSKKWPIFTVSYGVLF